MIDMAHEDIRISDMLHALELNHQALNAMLADMPTCDSPDRTGIEILNAIENGIIVRQQIDANLALWKMIYSGDAFSVAA